VLDLYKSPYQDVGLERAKIGDIWEIGPASVRKLEKIGVKTALQFKRCELRWFKKNFTVVGSRTLLELNGFRCFPLELAPPPKKSITCSRTFGEAVTSFNEV
jgi:DNA polymerase V